MLELDDIMKQMDLTNIYRTFHSNTKEYAFLSAPHGPFSHSDHILIHTPHTQLQTESQLIKEN